MVNAGFVFSFGRMTADEISVFVAPSRVYSRQDVLTRPCPVPAEPGVYGWWFRRWPSPVSTGGCRCHQGLVLLYAGISPDRPPANGRPASKQTIADRIRYHYTGNAEGSTLRKTLGCLLASELGIELRRVGSGSRMTFGAGEKVLSAWMAENAFVSWMARDAPPGSSRPRPAVPVEDSDRIRSPVPMQSDR